MAKKKGPPPIVYILIALVVGGGAWWWFSKPKDPNFSKGPIDAVSNALPGNTKLPEGITELNIDGATSLVEVNAHVKKTLEEQYPNLTVNLRANGTDAGIKSLIAGDIDVAAISRPLTDEEKGQGIDSRMVVNDSIAIIVGINNPIKGGLSKDQLRDVLQGRITNWSQLGGPDKIIQVINRPPNSGTYKTIQQHLLNGQAFGSGDNVVNMDIDSTTKMIQMLGTGGIGYATLSQAKSQQTVKILTIDGKHPSQDGYPLTRPLGYAYRTPMTPSASVWIDTVIKTK